MNRRKPQEIPCGLFCADISRVWRRGWDSNPCAIARKLISSQPRYDHFDTSPCIFIHSISEAFFEIQNRFGKN